MKTVYALALILGSITIHAQFIPNSNQAFQFASVYNPSFTGIENFGDIKLGYRYQWTGFGTHAPKFLNLVYNGRLTRPEDRSRNAFRPSSPVKVPKAKRIRQGISANLFNEDVGVFERWGGGVGYAFHYPLSDKNLWIATGISILFDYTAVNVQDVYLGANADPDPYYDQLVANGVNRKDLNARAGVLLYSHQFYLGFSYLPIWNKGLETAEGNLANTFYKGTFQAGVSLPVGDAFQFKPSVAGIWQEDDQVHIDYSIKGYYREKIWLGVSYRDVNSGVGLLGFNLNNFFSVTYSYEVPVSSLQQFANGSHELVLAVRLNNSGGYNQYVW